MLKDTKPILVFKDPTLVTKNKRTLKGIYYSLHNDGDCSRHSCNPCIFNTNNLYSNEIDFCVFYTVFSNGVFTPSIRMGKGTNYNQSRMYYCLMLFSLYNNAEKLSVLLEDI